jgi:glycosyltransferase involved in cell wall biosynthesis
MHSIAFIASAELVSWGGSEYCWSAAAERLARCGARVSASVLDWGVSVPQVRHLAAAGCRIFLRPQRSVPERIRRRLVFRHGYEWHHLRRIGKRADLVVISQGGIGDGLMWMEAARALGLKYVLIAQAANEQSWPSDEMAERLAPCYEDSCAAYFVSEANLTLARRQLVTSLGRGRVMRNPFNVRYDAAPAWPGDAMNRLFLACVGRLDPLQKGQDLLIEVLDRPRWRARSVHVTFVGRGFSERALRRTVDGLNMSNVEFAGFVEDIEQVWARHHALVLPSRFEGMPLALVEAMLCGRPSIVTDVAGHRELVRDGVNGFVARAPTVEFLDEAMDRAWESRHRLQEIGEVAARDVREWVSADPTGDFVHELEILASGSRFLPHT